MSIRTSSIRYLGEANNHGEAIRQIRYPGDAVLVIRGRPRALIVSCPCGCGDALTLNLDRRAGKAWLLYRRKPHITLYPSVWRDTGCESHFVIWRGRVSWIGTWDFDEVASEESGLADDIVSAVPMDDFVDAGWIAEKVGADPWNVLWECRRLVARQRLHEGAGSARGTFKRKN